MKRTHASFGPRTRCCSKSIIWCADVSIRLLVLTIIALTSRASAAAPSANGLDDLVRAAVVRAPQQRIGNDAEVTVDRLQIFGVIGHPVDIDATPAPDAR